MECLQQPGDYGCIDHIGIDAFLNVYAVKEDLHAMKEIKWDFCNFTLAEHYERDPEGSFLTYEKLLKEEHDLKIVTLLIFSGSFLELNRPISQPLVPKGGLMRSK